MCVETGIYVSHFYLKIRFSCNCGDKYYGFKAPCDRAISRDPLNIHICSVDQARSLDFFQESKQVFPKSLFLENCNCPCGVK
jgi:hypothetical protein